MAKTVVSYRETIAIQGFLGYLHFHFSRKISTTDTLLIAAISAWVHVESGSFAHIKGNNPFNIHAPARVVIVDGRKRLGPPGPLMRFASLAKGFEAMAKLLIEAPKGSLYNTALNALKRGGNDAAVDFLAAIAMSQFDATHYGATDWMAAYDQHKNQLIAAYVNTKGVQLRNPNVKQKPAKKLPVLPRDTQYVASTREYLDPWAVGLLYAGRHRRQSVVK